MSKLDAQRAMREARYAARNSSGPTRREAAGGTGTRPTAATAETAASPKETARATPVAKQPEAPAAKPAATGAGDSSALCGHTSMNGRACTRPAGHAEKSHRYS